MRKPSQRGTMLIPETRSSQRPSTRRFRLCRDPGKSFEGIDFANWGNGHPPDTNGDVGPTYYIQTMNTSIGIYDKSTGSRVAAFTFNTFMSQGNFGNLCDTNNFGDPVVLYDTFEDRWVITDFAFVLDGRATCSPRASPVLRGVEDRRSVPAAGTSTRSTSTTDSATIPSSASGRTASTCPRTCSAYPAGARSRARASGRSTRRRCTRVHPASRSSLSSSDGRFHAASTNARLQTGTPPAGTPDYFVSTGQFLNAFTVYKFHVEWDKCPTQPSAGRIFRDQPNCWPNSAWPTPRRRQRPSTSSQIPAMAQGQYTNIGGEESLWVHHTVKLGQPHWLERGDSNGSNSGRVRWYPVKVTGGSVATGGARARLPLDSSLTLSTGSYQASPWTATGDMAVGHRKSTPR